MAPCETIEEKTINCFEANKQTSREPRIIISVGLEQLSFLTHVEVAPSVQSSRHPPYASRFLMQTSPTATPIRPHIHPRAFLPKIILSLQPPLTPMTPLTVIALSSLPSVVVSSVSPREENTWSPDMNARVRARISGIAPRCSRLVLCSEPRLKGVPWNPRVVVCSESGVEFRQSVDPEGWDRVGEGLSMPV